MLLGEASLYTNAKHSPPPLSIHDWSCDMSGNRSKHAPDELVNILFAVAGVAPLHKVIADAREATNGTVHLERPQKFCAFLEIGPHSINLVD